jgi:hypothetical protein
MFRFSLCAFLLPFLLLACAPAEMPYHGFADQAALDKTDQIVIKESTNRGTLDPLNLAQEDQRYTHDNVAYDRMEEGYYQWGAKLYEMGYRDGFYVRDLAPKAFRHEMMDTYDHAIEAGFTNAEKNDPAHKS